MSLFARRTAIKAESAEQSLQAVSRLRRPKALYTVALWSEHLASRKAAIARLDNPKLLSKIANDRMVDPGLRLDAADKLPGELVQNVYYDIANDRVRGEEDRLRALAKVNNEDRIAHIAAGCDGLVWQAALARLTQPSSFIQLAMGRFDVRAYDGLGRLPDWSTPRHDPTTEDDYLNRLLSQLPLEKDRAEVAAAEVSRDIACMILESINDPAQLSMITNATPYPDVMIAAAKKLPDQWRVSARLEEMARKRTVDVESRLALADLLGRPDFVELVAADAAIGESSVAARSFLAPRPVSVQKLEMQLTALKRVHDQKLLHRVAKETRVDEVAEAALDRLDTDMLLGLASERYTRLSEQAVDRLLETGQGELLRRTLIASGKLGQYACGKLGHDFGENCRCRNCQFEDHSFVCPDWSCRISERELRWFEEVGGEKGGWEATCDRCRAELREVTHYETIPCDACGGTTIALYAGDYVVCDQCAGGDRREKAVLDYWYINYADGTRR